MMTQHSIITCKSFKYTVRAFYLVVSQEKTLLDAWGDGSCLIKCKKEEVLNCAETPDIDEIKQRDEKKSVRRIV